MQGLTAAAPPPNNSIPDMLLATLAGFGTGPTPGTDISRQQASERSQSRFDVIFKSTVISAMSAKERSKREMSADGYRRAGA